LLLDPSVSKREAPQTISAQVYLQCQPAGGLLSKEKGRRNLAPKNGNNKNQSFTQAGQPQASNKNGFLNLALLPCAVASAFNFSQSQVATNLKI